MIDIIVSECKMYISNDLAQHSRVQRTLDESLHMLTHKWSKEAISQDCITKMQTVDALELTLRGAFLSEDQIIMYLQDKAELNKLRKRYRDE